ncbi:MAG: sugar kinase [Spirochaetales bacterium]|nr:sugar kinase [Spirochaetales bacterium]
MSSNIVFKDAKDCEFDILSLGEVMLRLDPGFGRIHTARQFTAWEGGGEYNVARGFRRCFGKRAAVVTAFADNPVGRLVEDFILQGGVSTEFIKWFDYDGIGRNVRNGLNFTEKGFGVRGALGCSDRGNTAASQLKPGDIAWDEIFSRGVRIFHTGGIYAALSPTTPDVIIEAVKSAKKYGTVVSYDLNYRNSLWAGIGGQEKAIKVNREIAKYVDVMIGNEEDFVAALGFELDGESEFTDLSLDSYEVMIREVSKVYPNFKLIATTLRDVVSASINDWSAICYCGGEFFSSVKRERLEIFDRVGGGDSFASGLLYGLLEFGDPLVAIEYGAAHGALAMTTPGDTSMATLAEVKKLVAGKSARVDR